jgi:transposase
MKEFDARSFDHSTLEYIRIQTVKAVQEGYRIREVARIFCVHRASIHRWLKLARKGGREALKEKPVPGRKPAFNDQQEKILTLVCIYPPCFWIRVDSMDDKNSTGAH